MCILPKTQTGIFQALIHLSVIAGNNLGKAYGESMKHDLMFKITKVCAGFNACMYVHMKNCSLYIQAAFLFILNQK